MFALLLSYSDDPARLDSRPEHREKMAALRDAGKVLAAGPWADDSGALIVFMVDTEAQARELIAADPYLTGPGVQIEALQEWNAAVRHSLLEGL